MSRIKKSIIMILIITCAIILGMTNKAAAANHESTNNLTKGSTKSIGYNTMANADNIYCVAHGRALKEVKTYTVRSWLEIEGNKVTSSSTGKTSESASNGTLAAILGGALTQGYGSEGNYNPAQKALYGFWNDWVKDSGSLYGCVTYPNNTSISNQATARYIAQAKAAAKINSYHVKIYYLSCGAEGWQQLILVEPLKNTPPNEPKPGQTETTGYINVSGYVWEDVANSKDNTVNSKYAQSDNDLRVEGIKVHWKASDGTEIGTATTDKNGAYKLTTTIALYNHPYGIKDKTKYDQINNSYIEFEYNGLKYTTVAYNGNLSSNDTSKGKEDSNKRTALDEKFDRVENQAVYDGNQAIITGLPNTKISDANYTPELAVSASTMNITRNLMKTSETNKWTETKEFCVDHCQVGEGPHVVRVITTGGGSTITVYCNGKIDIKQNNGEYLDNVINGIKEIMGDEINKYGQAHYYSAGETNGPTHRDCRQGAQEIYVWNINNMNLGLTRREQPDGALTSDIEKVRVIMQNQEYTYKYGNRGIQDNEELFDYKVKFGNKYMQTYTRPVNPSDIAYVNYNNTDDLKVYVTYNIVLKNQSNTLTMKMNNIVNYYDGDYTIYTGPGTSTSAGWQETNGNNNGFKVAYNPVNITLAPGTKSDVIKLEFEVSQSKIKELQNQDTGFTFTNYTEITSFTTYYGEKTMCAERETATTKGRVGKQYAGLDTDSTPGNAIPGNEATYEDDTDRAPSFLLKKDSNYKTVSGTVYEDTQTDDSKKKNERLGDGQKADTEKGVANVKVELLKYNKETGEIEPAYLYYKDNGQSGTGVNGANKQLAVTYSDQNGNYSFGDGTTSGVVVDNYIIKYTYGNADGLKTTIDGEEPYINARNYKSTIITDSSIKNVMTGQSNDDKWHLTAADNRSVAIDDMDERLKQDTLKNSTYYNGENMSAYSKPFALQIEYTQDQTAKVDDNGGDFARDLSVFDFGIIERPRENVVINKTVSKIKVTLGNGQVLIEGDPRKDKLSYVKPLGLEERTTAKFDAMDAIKAISIEMDQELIQGARLEVWYSITLTNNGEKDYDYEKDSTYYNYGTNAQGDPLAVADLVVDYMSPAMSCTVGDDFKSDESTAGVNNGDWYRFDNGTAIDAEYLKNNGYISYKLNDTDEDKTYETIKNRNIQSMATTTFAGLKPGETKTSVIYASKTLANQEEASSYDNHVEIIALNRKTGRTIKNVEDTTRKQIDKEYQPGNYIPNLSAIVHQQDDDNIKVIITQPTGITNYTTIYIISAVVGLIVISGGIILIKKRFMNK